MPDAVGLKTHPTPSQLVPPQAGPAPARGVAQRRSFDALYGCRVHLISEGSAALQKRQSGGRPAAGPAGFALDSGHVGSQEFQNSKFI